MPPRLSAALAAVGVEASAGEFAAVESLMGGSFSGLSEAGRDPAARIDAAGPTSGEIRDWLSGLPIGQHAELRVAWMAHRLGARMSFETFAANIDDLWFPAMDDVVCLPHSDGHRMVLVLDHEELITFSSVSPCGDAGGQGSRQIRGEPTALLPAPEPMFPSRTTLRSDVFAIELRSPQEAGRENGAPAEASGIIVIGDFTETFRAPLGFWEPSDYRDSWRRAFEVLDSAGAVSGRAAGASSARIRWPHCPPPSAGGAAVAVGQPRDAARRVARGSRRSARHPRR
jgi:hypothetical protein